MSAVAIKPVTRGGPAKPPPSLDEIKARTVVDQASGCWLWLGAVDGHGYAQLRRRSLGGLVRITRLLIDAPSGLVVRHRCDTPRCVNPDHLQLGTQLDNIADTVARGRTARGERSGARRHPERLPRGERVASSKLTAATVAAIRADAGSAPQRVIAQRYGVNQSAVSRVLSGKSWAHVPTLFDAAPEQQELLP